jgi:hypothetical protein
MSDRLERERPRLERLLAASGMTFTEEPLADDRGALGAWRFTNAEGDVEADVYIVEADPRGFLEQLGEGAGMNGAIVFSVRYVGPPEDAFQGQFRAGSVIGALAGDE